MTQIQLPVRGRFDAWTENCRHQDRVLNCFNRVWTSCIQPKERTCAHLKRRAGIVKFGSTGQRLHNHFYGNSMLRHFLPGLQADQHDSWARPRQQGLTHRTLIVKFNPL